MFLDVQEGSGGNDNVFGEWGIDDVAPMISNSKAGAIFVSFWTGVGMFGYFLYTLDHPSNRYTVHMRMLSNMHHHSLPSSPSSYLCATVL
jgi:hypothetical protein